MAAQLVELFIAEKISSEEILRFIPSNDSKAICERWQLPAVNSTDFVYEFLTYLREQCGNVLEGGPRTNTVQNHHKDRSSTSSKSSFAKTPAKTTSANTSSKSTGAPRQSSASAEVKRSPKHDGSGTQRSRDQLDFTGSSLVAHQGSPQTSLSFCKEEFPSLGEASTPLKGEFHRESIRKTSKRAALFHSTPIRSSGNLEAATPPLASEDIFNRQLPKTNRTGRAKRASLTQQATPNHLKETSREGSASPKKRITPTPVRPWEQSPVVIADFVNTPEMSRSPKEATQKQRELARSMRQDTASSSAPSTDEAFDSPEMRHVTRQDALDRLAYLYANFLTRNFVPNLLVELHFVVQLVVAKLRKAATQPSLLLGTASNCAYFAVQVLKHTEPLLLAVLKTDMLRLLHALPHVEQMSRELHRRLDELCAVDRTVSTFRSSFLQAVSFDASIDNADNFPTQQQFAAFRRQRDAFCQLLKDWQEATFGLNNNNNNDLRLGARVRGIFELSMEPCNVFHLAQLLARQLIVTCCGNLDLDESVSSENVLHDFRNISPDKLSKLKGRLEKPVCTTLSTRYQFSGYQAFFHSFIVEANYAQFHSHLKAVLLSRIHDEDRHGLTPDDTETSIDSQVREELCTHVYRLRLYGAFLGLVEFLPYSGGDPATAAGPQISEQQRALRERMPPLVDLAECLRSSLLEQRLILTMSWLTSYLSLADGGVATLASYQETWRILSDLFRSCDSLDLHSILFRMMIGGVFHLLDIPISFSGPTVDVPLKAAAFGEFIDLQLLHMMFPFLTNLKSIILDYYHVHPSEVRLKKITPVPVGLESRHELGLDAKLEETFFFVAPPSVKRSVTHVAREIPENVVKSKKAELERQFRDEIRASLRQVRASGETVTSELMRTLAQNMCARLQLKAENALLPSCDSNMSRALGELLPADCGSDALAVAAKICAKRCHLQLRNWIRCRISTEYVHSLVRECNKETPAADAVDSLLVDEQALEQKPVEAHRTSDSVCHVIDSLEHLVRVALEGRMLPWKVTIEKARQALLHRREWTQPSLNAAESLLVDLGMASIVRTAKMEVAESILAIFGEVGLHESYRVDSARNRYICEHFANDGEGELSKTLLTEYQRMIDTVYAR